MDNIFADDNQLKTKSLERLPMMKRGENAVTAKCIPNPRISCRALKMTRKLMKASSAEWGEDLGVPAPPIPSSLPSHDFKKASFPPKRNSTGKTGDTDGDTSTATSDDKCQHALGSSLHSIKLRTPGARKVATPLAAIKWEESLHPAIVSIAQCQFDDSAGYVKVDL